MGDIWPYGGPLHASSASVRQRLGYVGFRGADIDIGLAIGYAESSLDLHVINDSPNTGDYSVGIWQINYYGYLYASRAREFGTPKYLVTNGLNAQTYACRRVFLEAGGRWTPWSTYNSGAYKRYLGRSSGGSGGGGGGGGGGGAPPPRPAKPPPHNIVPPTEDYSGTIRSSTGHVHGIGDQLKAGVIVLSRL